MHSMPYPWIQTKWNQCRTEDAQFEARAYGNRSATNHTNKHEFYHANIRVIRGFDYPSMS